MKAACPQRAKRAFGPRIHAIRAQVAAQASALFLCPEAHTLPTRPKRGPDRILGKTEKARWTRAFLNTDDVPPLQSECAKNLVQQIRDAGEQAPIGVQKVGDIAQQIAQQVPRTRLCSDGEVDLI